MKKYTYDRFIKDLGEMHRFEFRYQRHIYLLFYELDKGWYFARDGEQIGDYYADVKEFIETIKVGGKTFRELFEEEERGENDLRMVSRL